MRFLTVRAKALPPVPSLNRPLFGERRHTPLSRAICGLLGGAGLLLLAHGAAELLQVAAMHRWPLAQATVLAVSVERSWRQETWEPQVRYTFEVEGRRYTSTRLALTPVTFSNHRDAEAYVQHHWHDRFRPGTVIALRYNPANPLDSFVEMQMTPRLGLLAGAGTLLACLSLGLALRLWRRPVPLGARSPAPFQV